MDEIDPELRAELEELDKEFHRNKDAILAWERHRKDCNTCSQCKSIQFSKKSQQFVHHHLICADGKKLAGSLVSLGIWWGDLDMDIE